MDSKKTLLILAAGFGSRYNGLKQIDSILENEHVIMEYSIYDALKAGFNKVVIIINPQIPQEFKNKMEKILSERNVELEWVVQENTTDIPAEFAHLERSKPWGTGHAIFCARNVIDGPFTIINADDYYGQEIYNMAASLMDKAVDDDKLKIFNIAFPVGMTVTENGTVCRGVCKTDEQGKLLKIEEICSIQKEGEKVFYEENGEKVYIDRNTPASMNFWVFPKNVFASLEEDFVKFLSNNPDKKQEYFIPAYVQNMIEAGKTEVFVELSPTKWKGVTYADDKQEIQKFLQGEISGKKYPENLWN